VDGGRTIAETNTSVSATGEARATRLESKAEPFTLEDQSGDRHEYTFPMSKVSVLLVADKEGSKQVEGWVAPLHERYRKRIDIDGIAFYARIWGACRRAV